MARFVLLVFVFLMLSVNSMFADTRYDFVEVGTGDTLASLELATLPALAPNVSSFALAPKAFEFIDFNWGDFWPTALRSPVVFPVFNAASSPGATIIDDGASGLQGSAGDVTFTRWVLGPEEYTVNLYFHPRSPADALDGTDEIEILVGGPGYFVSGNWVPASSVPEPSSVMMAVLGFVTWTGLARSFVFPWPS